jgi:opacity protein-like surface antigen
MKKFLLIAVSMLLFALPVFSQDVEPPQNWLAVVEGFSTWFGTFAGIAALGTFVAGFVNGLIKSTNKFLRQFIAWVVCIALAVVGNLVNLGFLSEATWLITVIYGFGAGLVANGLFDVPLVYAVIVAIESALGNKKEE